MRIILFLFFVLMITALFVVSNNNLYIYNEDDFNKFSEIYVKWTDKIIGNFKQSTGYIVGLEWRP